MAKYTIELKDVVETHNIFDFRYDFYDESKKHEFEQRFIKHFYFREIGCETIDRFKFYLEDKFHTIFPYYNELFKLNSIEYNPIENYNMSESQTVTRNKEDKNVGFTSQVGQFFGEQNTSTDNDRITDTTGNIKTTGNDTENETTESTVKYNGLNETDTTKTTTTSNNGESDVNETNNINNTKGDTGTVNTSVSETGTSNETKKFLDTPQGALDLDKIDYLTTLNQDSGSTGKTGDTLVTNNLTSTETGANTKTGKTTNTESGTATETGNSVTTTEDITTTESERNLNRNTETSSDTLGNETVKDTTKGNTTDEQKTTNDSNVRTYGNSDETETLEHTKHGNIGVTTSQQMLESEFHIKKILYRIEHMFFNECEDLFMLVY